MAAEEGKGSVEDAIASLENDDFSDVIGKKRRYYTPNEVSMHNIAEDCWVSIFGKVYDLSAFLSKHEGPLAQPIVNFAGQDISSWFDEETGGVKHELDETTGLLLPFLPHGRFIHVAPAEPVSDWRTDFGWVCWRGERDELETHLVTGETVELGTYSSLLLFCPPPPLSLSLSLPPYPLSLQDPMVEGRVILHRQPLN